MTKNEIEGMRGIVAEMYQLTQIQQKICSENDPDTEKLAIISRKRQELSDKILNFEEKIAILPTNERMIMRYRYLDNKSWGWIADKLKFSTQHAFRLHHAAITTLSKF